MTAQTIKTTAPSLDTVDPVWTKLRSEAERIVAREPALAGLVYSYVLNHERLEGGVAHRIADRLGSPALDSGLISRAFAEMCEADDSFSAALRCDLVAVYD